MTAKWVQHDDFFTVNGITHRYAYSNGEHVFARCDAYFCEDFVAFDEHAKSDGPATCFGCMNGG